MSGVGLHDHRAPSRDRRGGVTSWDRKSEWKVARSKHGNRPDRNEHAPHVGKLPHFRRLGVIDRRLDEGAITDHAGKKAELKRRPAQFPLESGGAERSLTICDFDEFTAVRFETLRHLFEQLSAPFKS